MSDGGASFLLTMEEILSKQLLLKQDKIKTRFEVADSRSKELQKINALLEKLDLSVDKNASSMRGNVGLGTSNILSMACELLLHKEAEKTNRSSFLLIEEPEAHIHAQRQLKLVQSLEEAPANQQIIITTHSPLLASVVKLGNINTEDWENLSSTCVSSTIERDAIIEHS